ncbi:GNAT family N-acetyltransferase [Flavobacteriaceae bacterium S0825]|uniref:GNAT family N-acetyltransferase n=1 Tax=Gaetbulibacter sp. S0825 TaxID=2720084 RepID=UPI00143217AF|nr:GNAT family N-acetyltransferase [Gaetbulibacter sp. S0825]MCK0107822.1 GNAT family N-acetyltransferase [Flavobacteriaceae bacterium S0825]NIX63458.1 GNAT family N-acetyltransferase [Gaetbulibacter sp. S0825]
MTPIVRKATLEDLPVLMEFMDGLVNAEKPMDPTIKEGKVIYYDLSKIMANKESDLYVVELNNELVASGYAKIKDDRPYLKHKKQGYLGFMFVPEKHRGNGYNKLIMDALLKWCEDRNIFEIRLDVYQDNPSAIKAYEKAGLKKHLITMRMNLKD